jgi:hypothetical protein
MEANIKPENKILEVDSIDLKVKGLTGYVIRLRLAKSKTSAEKKMLITSLVFFALSIYFFAKAANIL